MSTTNGQPPKTSGLFGGIKLSKVHVAEEAKAPKPAKGGFGFAKPVAKKAAPFPGIAGRGMMARPGVGLPPVGGVNYKI